MLHCAYGLLLLVCVCVCVCVVCALGIACFCAGVPARACVCVRLVARGSASLARAVRCARWCVCACVCVCVCLCVVVCLPCCAGCAAVPACFRVAAVAGALLCSAACLPCRCLPWASLSSSSRCCFRCLFVVAVVVRLLAVGVGCCVCLVVCWPSACCSLLPSFVVWCRRPFPLAPPASHPSRTGGNTSSLHQCRHSASFNIW